MKREFIVECVDCDNNSLNTKELGVIHIDRKTTTDEYILGQAKQILKKDVDLWDYIHQATDEFLTESSEIDESIDWKHFIRFVRKHGLMMFIQYINDDVLYKHYKDGLATHGVSLATGYSFVTIRERKCEQNEYLKEIDRLKSQVKRQEKEIEKLKNLLKKYEI